MAITTAAENFNSVYANKAGEGDAYRAFQLWAHYRGYVENGEYTIPEEEVIQLALQKGIIMPKPPEAPKPTPAKHAKLPKKPKKTKASKPVKTTIPGWAFLLVKHEPTKVHHDSIRKLILQFLANHPDERYTISQLAEASGLLLSSIRACCGNLVRKKLVIAGWDYEDRLPRRLVQHKARIGGENNGK